MILESLIPSLRGAEGWSPTVYIDTTGNLTIGYGFNLGKLHVSAAGTVKVDPVNGISVAVGEQLILSEVVEVITAIRASLPWWDRLDDVRQEVLADMAYNLGMPGLLKWPIFLRQVRTGDYASAAGNMRSTLWYRQTGRRARRLVKMMETGQDQPPLKLRPKKLKKLKKEEK
jgi:lysozyme